jgi:nucleoid DNA-binding protein
MSDALVSQLARALNLPPDAARHTLDHLVATLQEQIEATGQARVPGLGTFQRGERGLTFRPDDALARAVNHRYAGLRPIEAGARSEKRETEPEDPFAEAAPGASAETTVGFQPLDAYVEPDEPVEPEEAVEAEETWEDEPEAFEEPEPEETDTFEETTAAADIPPESLLDDDAFVTATPDEEAYDEIAEAPSEEAADLSTDVWALPPSVEEEVETPADFEEAPIDETEQEAAEPEPVVAEDETSEADLTAGPDLEEEPEFEAEPEAEPEFEAEPDFEEEVKFETEVEFEDETEPAMEPEAADVLPAAETDSEALDSLDDLAIPEHDGHEYEDEEDDEEAATAILPIMAASDEVSEGSSEAEEVAIAEADATPEPVAPPPPEIDTVAPAVTATSREPAPSKTATRDRRRGLPVLPIVIGLAALVGVVALLWLLNREPSGPIVAEEPVPTDTTRAVIEAPPTATDTLAATATADTAVVAEPPAEPAPPANPLQGSAPIDPTAGGFAWVVGSELSREPAERRVAEFRAQGLRAGVIAEEAAGRTRYRVAIGQFESIEQAERFRPDLPAGVPTDTWLLRL